MKPTLIAAAALALAACAVDRDRPPIIAEKERVTAPQFQLKDAAGQPVQLSDYKGQVVLLNFWATWCGPCRTEIPWFVEFQNKYRNRGFTVLGVSFDENGWEAVTPYAKARKVNYTLALGTAELMQLYGNSSFLPTTYIIDRQGRVSSINLGMYPKRIYEEEIESALGSGGSDSKAGAEFGVAGRSLIAQLRPR